jgi:Stress responsive A/B Barrel Domain
MIGHLVLFAPLPSISAEERRGILETVAEAIRGCPTVRACRVGRRVRHGLPGYEQAMHDDYQFTLILEFDDLEGLRTYLRHPDHARLGQLFTSAASASLAYDYEFVTLDEARSRWGS